MYTVLDLATFVFKLVNQPEVTAAISGNVYKGFRPAPSVKEDIVVNAVSLTDGTLQIGTANVNIFVPGIEDTSGQLRQNLARFNAIQDVVLPLVKEAYFDEGNVWYSNSQMIPTDDHKQHFLNLRLSARLYNNP